MSDGILQAIQVGVRVFVVAGLTALGADLANIVQIGTGGDVITGPLVLSIGTAVISAILKAIGGPTIQAPDAGKLGASKVAGGKKPSILSV